jgi:hypothetical protein
VSVSVSLKSVLPRKSLECFTVDSEIRKTELIIPEERRTEDHIHEKVQEVFIMKITMRTCHC